MRYKIVKFFLRPLRSPVIWARNYYASYRLSTPDNVYNAWAHTNEEHCFVRSEIKKSPLISIVVPVYNPVHAHLQELVYSIANQHYENWELILVNASDRADSRRQTEDCQQVDTRIKVVDPGKNGGIAANTNFGIKHASGEYIAFCDHDDLLHPCALHAATEQLNSKQQPALIYTDEDKVSSDNERFFGPHFKDDYSPDLLRNVNYINHLTVVKTEMVRGVEGLRHGYDGAQDYDLLLRIIDKYQPTICHIPKVLYHWRASETSTAQDISNKTYIFTAGEKTVNDHLKRNNIPAKAKAIVGRPGFYRLEYKPVSFSIIVGPTDIYQRPAAAHWMSQLIGLAHKLPDGISVQVIAGDWCQEYLKDKSKTATLVPEDESYWQSAAQHVGEPVVVCFQAAALPAHAGGLVQLAAVAAAMNREAASPILLNKDGIVMNAGITKIFGGQQKKFLEGYKLTQPTYHGSVEWVRNPDDLATHVVALKKERLEELVKSDKRGIFGTGATVSEVPAAKDWQYLVWAHEPFEYMGMLTPRENDIHESLELTRFRPSRTSRLDHWGNRYDRAEK